MNTKAYIHILLAFLLFAPYLTRADNYTGLSADSLYSLGKQSFQADPDLALSYLFLADSIVGGNYVLKADINRYISNSYHYKGEYQMAADVCQKAVNIRTHYVPRDSDNISNLAALNYNLTINYRILEKIDSALLVIKRAAKFYHQVGNDYSEGICYDLEAQLYQQIAEPFFAQRCAYAELAINEKMNDSIGIAFTKDLLSNIKSDMKQFREELQLQREALDIRRQIGDSVLLAYSYNNIGLTFIQLEEYDSAFHYLSASLKLKESFSEDQAYQIPITNASSTLDYRKYWREAMLASTYKNIAAALNAQNKDDESIVYSQKAYDYYKLMDQDYDYADAAILMANSYFNRKQYSRAIHYLEESLSIAQKSNYKLVKYKAMQLLSRCYAKVGRSAEAFDMADYLTVLHDSLENEDLVRRMTLMESEYEYNKIRETDSIKQYHERLALKRKHDGEMQQKRLELYLLLAFVLVAVVIAVLLFRNYRLRKDNEQSALKHKALEVERTLLRTQMNPHFIFNALNSIQSFIVDNDQSAAELYLSKFAKLIRMILDNSMKQRVLLSDELLSLSLYLDLERVRFANKFKYKINLNDDIEDDMIFVPPMLIQPFVENAILHGLMHKESADGLITVNINEQPADHTLVCEIVDNGIGRKAAAEYSLGNKKHRSVGMQLTRDRLQELNNQTQQGFTCSISDLFDEQGKPMGTKVVIIIPYSEDV